MSYLLDTDLTADWLSGRQRAVRFVSSLGRDLAISIVTYGEVYEGIYFGRDPKRAEYVFHQFLRMVDVLPIGRQVMRRFAQMRGSLRASGQMIGDADTLIAATAIYYDCTLVTGNLQHFGRVPNLKVRPVQ